MLSPHIRLISALSLAAGLGVAAAASAQDDDYPQITFEYNPSYYDENQVSLTFDDGPGWAPQHTLAVLDILAEYDVKATFFINTGTQATTIDNEMSKLAVQRILDEGHELGTHTLNHQHLVTLSMDQVDAEINGVQDSIEALGRDHRITLFRAPFGEPYQWKWQADQGWELEPMAQDGVSKYAEIAPLAAATMVHVGWNLDSDDWRCAGMALPGETEGECFSRTIIEKLSGTWDDPWSEETVKYYGNILMHSIAERTAQGLPKVLDYLRDNDYEIVSTEYAICRKYGSSSAKLVAGETGGCGDVGPGDDDDDGSEEDDGSDEDDDDAEDDEGDGPDVIRDPNGCAVGAGANAPWGWLGLGLLVAAFVSRRRWRA
jgi:MYXO-CTERM domain-containing protein